MTEIKKIGIFFFLLKLINSIIINPEQRNKSKDLVDLASKKENGVGKIESNVCFKIEKVLFF